MPHLFVNRPRLHDLTKGSKQIEAQFRWETINAFIYKAGGVIFIAGSILFFPRFEAYADWGAWTYFVGSFLYLIVTGHDLMEVVRYRRIHGKGDRYEKLEYIAAVSYLAGTCLFAAGSIFFLSDVGWYHAGAWLFIAGSLLFVLGACLNVLMITEESDMQILQLMNLTAISFVVGSVLFAVASVPYLWTISSPTDRKLIDGFLAWQFLIGSLLFLIGGIFNYWRAYLSVRRAVLLRTRSDGAGC
jgi:hypothetical protein